MMKNAGKLLITALILTVLASCDGMYESAGLRIQEGNTAYVDGRYEEALTAYRDGQIDIPGEKGVALNIGDALYQLEKPDEAQEAYADALAGGETDLRADAMYNIGNSVFQQQQIQEAIERYEGALELNPGDMDAKFNLELAQLMLNQAAQESEKQQQREEPVSMWAKQRAYEAEELARQGFYAEAYRTMERTVAAEQAAARQYGDFTERLGELSGIFGGE
jgi:Ca-activated chloride channel homolog